ncbi:MAG: hypothetical protein V3S55_09615 [Nitrospiraceae bacterium]
MTPTPWKALDIADTTTPGPVTTHQRYAMVTGPDGAVIVSRMNRVDAHHLVKVVNEADERFRSLHGRPLMG